MPLRHRCIGNLVGLVAAGAAEIIEGPIDVQPRATAEVVLFFPAVLPRCRTRTGALLLSRAASLSRICTPRPPRRRTDCPAHRVSAYWRQSWPRRLCRAR